MATTDLESKLVTYIKDAHAMEQNVLHMLNTMVLTTADEDIKKGFEAHKEETRLHAERLRERLEAHGESTSKLKEATAVLGALAKGTADAVRKDKAGQNARDAFVTEHLEIASYELLERLATRAGDEDTAKVARQNREEEQAMADMIAANWDRFVDLTIEEEGLR